LFDVITVGGSPSGNSRSSAVLEYARRTIEHCGLRTWGISVRDLPPEDLIYGRLGSPALAESMRLLRQARAVIIATPVYKASYSGVLKTFLDLLPERILDGKLVLPIATGGSPAHLLAIDYALRPVLTALGAQHTLRGVYIVDSQIQHDATSLLLDLAVEERLTAALQYLVDELIGAEAIEFASMQNKEATYGKY
jgi:FMN reductase